MNEMESSNRTVVFLGGGGHAAVCLDVFTSAGWTVIGYLAPVPSELALPYLGDDDVLDGPLPLKAAVFAAIGGNRPRLALIDRAVAGGHRVVSAVSEFAVVSSSASIGRGTIIMPGAIVNARAVVGDGVIINTSASIDHDSVIGSGAHVAPGCHLAGGVSIGTGAFLGVGCSVIPEVAIGAWSIVGAGSVVVRDIPDRAKWMGVPARPK